MCEDMGTFCQQAETSTNKPDNIVTTIADDMPLPYYCCLHSAATGFCSAKVGSVTMPIMLSKVGLAP